MLKAYYRISKLDFNKEVISKGRKKLSRSFLIGFIGNLYRLVSQNAYQLQDISNTSRNEGASNATLFLNAGGGLSDMPGFVTNSYQMGIVVGTGTNVVAPTDYGLQTIVVHGTSTGKLEYLGMLVDKVAVSQPNATINLERVFRNSSGGSVTINEIGVYGCASQSYMYCFIRDKLATGVVVNDSEYLKVTYTLQITV